MSLTARIYEHLPSISWTKSVGVNNTLNGISLQPSKADLLWLQIFIRNVTVAYASTPDWPYLEQTEYVPVFIYCNMMRGGSLHHVIEGLYKTEDDEGNSLCPYVFSGKRYEVWQTRMGRDTYPIALPSGAPIPKLSIVPGEITTHPIRGLLKGRLYFVRSDMMKELDKAKGNGVYFERRRVWIKIPYRVLDINANGVNPSPEAIQPMEAWMYVARKEYWDNVPVTNLARCAVVKKRYGEYPGRYGEDTTPYISWRRDEPYYFFQAWSVANK